MNDDNEARARELAHKLDMFCSFYLTDADNYAKCAPDQRDCSCFEMLSTISTALAAAEARGRIAGLREAAAIAELTPVPVGEKP